MNPTFVARRSYAGRDLRHRTLDSHHFKLCDFRGADLRHTDLSYASFDYVNTHDPEYGRTDVTGVRWSGADLRGVTAERVIGWPADFRTA